MERLSALLALFWWIPQTGEVMWNFDVVIFVSFKCCWTNSGISNEFRCRSIWFNCKTMDMGRNPGVRLDFMRLFHYIISFYKAYPIVEFPWGFFSVFISVCLNNIFFISGMYTTQPSNLLIGEFAFFPLICWAMVVTAHVGPTWGPSGADRTWGLIDDNGSSNPWEQGSWGQHGVRWGRQDPGGPHVGPIYLAIWDGLVLLQAARHYLD